MILIAEAWPVVALLLPTLASTTTLVLRAAVAILDPRCDAKTPPHAIIRRNATYVSGEHADINLLQFRYPRSNAAMHPSNLVPNVYRTLGYNNTNSYEVRTSTSSSLHVLLSIHLDILYKDRGITQQDRWNPLGIPNELPRNCLLVAAELRCMDRYPSSHVLCYFYCEYVSTVVHSNTSTTGVPIDIQHTQSTG